MIVEDGTRCPRHAPNVVVRTVEGAAVLLDLTTEMYYSLNEVGTRVWELVNGQRPIVAIVDVIANEYDAERSQISEDVRGLLGELTTEGLITWDAH